MEVLEYIKEEGSKKDINKAIALSKEYKVRKKQR